MRYESEAATRVSVPGVVTGLAWKVREGGRERRREGEREAEIVIARYRRPGEGKIEGGGEGGKEGGRGIRVEFSWPAHSTGNRRRAAVHRVLVGAGREGGLDSDRKARRGRCRRREGGRETRRLVQIGLEF